MEKVLWRANQQCLEINWTLGREIWSKYNSKCWTPVIGSWRVKWSEMKKTSFFYWTIPKLSKYLQAPPDPDLTATPLFYTIPVIRHWPQSHQKVCVLQSHRGLSCFHLPSHSFLSLQCNVKAPQSCLTLWYPRDYSLPGSSVHGILQARILEWVAIPFSRGSSPVRDRTHVPWVSCIGRRILYD